MSANEEWNVAPFWFEGNSAWGWVTTRAEWQRIVKVYAENSATSYIDLMKAKRGPDKRSGTLFGEPVMAPNFGFRGEHRGEQTLGDHFAGKAAP